MAATSENSVTSYFANWRARIKDKSGGKKKKRGTPAKTERGNYPCGIFSSLIQIRVPASGEVIQDWFEFNFYYVGVSNTSNPNQAVDSEPVRTFADIYTHIKRVEWQKLGEPWNKQNKNKHNDKIPVSWLIISVENAETTEKDIVEQLGKDFALNAGKENSESRRLLYIVLGTWPEKFGSPKKAELVLEALPNESPFSNSYYEFLEAWFPNQFHYGQSSVLVKGLSKTCATVIDILLTTIKSKELSNEALDALIAKIVELKIAKHDHHVRPLLSPS